MLTTLYDDRFSILASMYQSMPPCYIRAVVEPTYGCMAKDSPLDSFGVIIGKVEAFLNVLIYCSGQVEYVLVLSHLLIW